MTLPYARKQGACDRPRRSRFVAHPPDPFPARTFALFLLVLLFVLVVGPAQCRVAGRCVRCLWDRRSLKRTGVWAHTRI